jgi:hypothetical protein
MQLLSASFGFSFESMKKITQATVDPNAPYAAQAMALIQRYFSNSGTVGITYSASSPTVLQFHDNVAPEALHLVILFDKTVNVNFARRR